MDYINIHSIKVKEKLPLSPLLSFTGLHGITYITHSGHLVQSANNFYITWETKLLKQDMSMEFPGGRGGVERVGVRMCRLSGQESEPDKSVYQNYNSTVSAVSLFLQLPFYY